MEAQRRQQSVHEGTSHPETAKDVQSQNRAREAEQEHHSRPVARRVPVEKWKHRPKDLLDSRNDDQLPNPEEYDIGDALLDDLIGNTKYNSSQPTPKPVYLGNKNVITTIVWQIRWNDTNFGWGVVCS
jgi:hypothetical protein